MKKLVLGFESQLSEAIEIGNKLNITTYDHLNNIVVSGLGGSGIGGSLVHDWVKSELKIPFIINKSYHLPVFCNENTLVIISSFSGNTEETVHAFHEAMEKKCKIVVITSGGECEKIALENHVDLILIPKGISPRACIGYSFVQIMYVLNLNNIISNQFVNQLKKSIQLINAEEQNIQTIAKEIADKIYDKIPIIYASDAYEATAVRWKQQINENGKQVCWHNCIPEMNHNEIVGWRSKIDQIAVLFFKSEDDYIRNKQRIEINRKEISKYTNTIIDINSKGESLLERSIYLIHIGDWVSCFLADLRNFDPIEVNVIDALKKELATLKQ